MLIEVPSGQEITLQDVIWNAPGPDGLALRFRFLAPGIAPGGGVDFDTAAADMQHLCDTYALPRIADQGPHPEQVIISLSDVAVAFGEAAPEATQFFESFRIEDGVCVWEIF
ncbi:MAG: acetolactate synthase [Rhodobacter sp.]|nr:acetolactate synthase [Rhodobacter sp.]